VLPDYVNQSTCSYIDGRQLNDNSHWRLLRVGALDKPGLEVTHKRVSQYVRVAAVKRQTVPSGGPETWELRGPIFVVRLGGTIRSSWAAEWSMMHPQQCELEYRSP